MKASISQMTGRAGFALPAVLLISTGVMILLVTLMTVVELERTTSKARVGAYQADLAVESGLEEAKMLLAVATASDTYAIASLPFAIEFDDNGDGSITPEEDGELARDSGERGRPYLYAIQGQTDGDDLSYNWLPLFATNNGPNTDAAAGNGVLLTPTDPGLEPAQGGDLDAVTAVNAVPHLQAPVTSWRVIRDQEGVPIARYSYWVEDMQGYIDAEYVPGNTRRGAHARANEGWTDNLSEWDSQLGLIARDYVAGGGRVPLWPAPGLNPGYVEEVPGFFNPENRLLSEAAIHTIDRSTEGVMDTSSLDDRLRTLTSRALTPASLLALNGAQAPIERVPTGPNRGRIAISNENEGPSSENRWIEENFTSRNREWEEQALIPFVSGIEPAVMGFPQLNLNQLLEEADGPSFGGLFSPANRVVAQMAGFISRALPDFARERQGGFPEDYLMTLSASALDYADENDQPVVSEGAFRGIDSHPFISEYLMTTSFQWTSHPDDEEPSNQFPELGEMELQGEWILRSGDNTYLLFTVEHFCELWNMNNHQVEGDVEFRFENAYSMDVLFEELTFSGDVLANQGGPASNRSWSVHSMVRDPRENAFYSPARRVSLLPNERRLIRVGAVRYGLRIGDRSAFLPPNSSGMAFVDTIREQVPNQGYRMRWNGQVVERSGGGVFRRTINQLVRRETVTSAQICGTWGVAGSFYTGNQDLRQSWWAGVNGREQGAVSENSYPQNYTPGRRNVRIGSLAGRPNEPFARTLPSEWPDGGHDESFEVGSFRDLTRGLSGSDTRPDDPRFIGSLDSDGRGGTYLAPEGDFAPIFLSNLGRYFSETELGNVFDPIMWRGRSNPGQSVETWPFRELNFAEVSQVSNRSTPAVHVGGGNTLRIGRPEHERFTREPGLRASRLLDLFHCGVPLSRDPRRRVGNTRSVEGHLNVNTAPREVLRALAAGLLVTDPAIARELAFDTQNTFAPRVVDAGEPISATTSASSGEGRSRDEAGLIADAIVAGRPYVSRSQLADLEYTQDHPNEDLRGQPVFGNKLNHTIGTQLQRSDRAAEEVFARVYNSSTIRSRNFRIHVVGQALEETPSGRLRVKSTRKKSYRVFADAGSRNVRTGQLIPENIEIETLYETNL